VTAQFRQLTLSIPAKIKFEHDVTRFFRRLTAGVGYVVGGVLGAAGLIAMIPVALVSLPALYLIRQERPVAGGLLMAPAAIAAIPVLLLGSVGLLLVRKAKAAFVDPPTLMYTQVRAVHGQWRGKCKSFQPFLPLALHSSRLPLPFSCGSWRSS
jgi:hypothetical protein